MKDELKEIVLKQLQLLQDAVDHLSGLEMAVLSAKLGDALTLSFEYYEIYG